MQRQRQRQRRSHAGWANGKEQREEGGARKPEGGDRRGNEMKNRGRKRRGPRLSSVGREAELAAPALDCFGPVRAPGPFCAPELNWLSCVRASCPPCSTHVQPAKPPNPPVVFRRRDGCFPRTRLPSRPPRGSWWQHAMLGRRLSVRTRSRAPMQSQQAHDQPASQSHCPVPPFDRVATGQTAGFPHKATIYSRHNGAVSRLTPSRFPPLKRRWCASALALLLGGRLML